MTAIRANVKSLSTPTATKRTLSGRSLTTAKAKFMETVNLRIEELMCCKGYNRINATRTLIREIGREVNAPTEMEIFQAMEANGIGLDDAVKVLIVSKAVHRSMKELGLSAIEAIEDLTMKISIKNIFQASLYESNVEEVVDQTRIMRPLQHTSKPAVNSNPNIAQRIVAAKKTKLKPGKAATKATNVRKRSFPSEEVKQTDHFGRARVNSMSKEVNVKLKSTKQPSESFGRVPTLSGNRGKRISAENTSVQSCAKRPREA